MKTIDENNEVARPGVARFCTVLAYLSAGVGGFMIFFTISGPAVSDTVSVVLAAIGLVLSSVFWFAIAEVIILLAQIAHNTRVSRTDRKA
jgi:uncharacterized membrane protein (Fun14 family)